MYFYSLNGFLSILVCISSFLRIILFLADYADVDVFYKGIDLATNKLKILVNLRSHL